MDHYFSLGFRGLKVGAGSDEPGKGWYFPATSAEAVDFEADKLAFMRAHGGPDALLMPGEDLGYLSSKSPRAPKMEHTQKYL